MFGEYGVVRNEDGGIKSIDPVQQVMGAFLNPKTYGLIFGADVIVNGGELGSALWDTGGAVADGVGETWGNWTN